MEGGAVVLSRNACTGASLLPLTAPTASGGGAPFTLPPPAPLLAARVATPAIAVDATRIVREEESYQEVEPVEEKEFLRCIANRDFRRLLRRSSRNTRARVASRPPAV
jgi:hypothetical protein